VNVVERRQPVAAPEEERRVPARPDAPAALGTVVLVLTGPLPAGRERELCDVARLLLESTGAGVLTCDVAAVGRPDAGTVDALARVALTARRLGRSVMLRDPCPRLQALLVITGLDATLPYALTPPSGDP
jgi:ABC-type transporter Mla MlaB component